MRSLILAFFSSTSLLFLLPLSSPLTMITLHCSRKAKEKSPVAPFLAGSSSSPPGQAVDWFLDPPL
ncbi:hypothetical protein C7212DRAFT_324475 [Tuber magnatum]|uniref:Ig-like domain-containing protein n=1 Tax=Tuber magnatum TaxID=42249 RepID=A0A317SLJ6_9PEZI|nr:hypothetical protein C7212DRAFT_324475 [Tuber magnatum]